LFPHQFFFNLFFSIWYSISILSFSLALFTSISIFFLQHILLIKHFRVKSNYCLIFMMMIIVVLVELILLKWLCEAWTGFIDFPFIQKFLHKIIVPLSLINWLIHNWRFLILWWTHIIELLMLRRLILFLCWEQYVFRVFHSR
jgi:hypothetical protein